MKKIITLVTMFVLSAGCLMAQGVFTYQAVVYDGTSLVVDQDVTATVTITDAAGHSYTQNFENIHTSPNGLAMLPIGEVDNTDFASIDWSTANIKVVFNNTIGATAAAEQIPAVPYALQSNAALNTQMVADYVRHATMQDVLDILAATEHNVIDATTDPQLTLHDAVLAALVDSVKNNYPLAKEIMLSYIAQANADDAADLFAALTGNEQVMKTLASIVDANLETPAGKQMIYEVLVAYASQLTDGDVQAILNAIPDDARNEAVSKALLYFLGLQINYADEDIHAAMEEIAKYYIEHISTTQVTNLINTIEGNESAMSVLEPQLYAWIDQYVHKVINEYLNENYYYCEGGAPDLCAVNAALQPTTTCLSAPATFTAPSIANDSYTAIITYGGTTPSTVAPSSLELRYTPFENSETVPQSLALDYVSAVNADNQIIVEIPADRVADFYNAVHQPGDASNQVAVMIVFSGLGCTPNYVQIDIFF